MAIETSTTVIGTTDSLLQHWQGHRRLTRKTIEAFPEDKLFQFSIGGMRTFGEMAGEMLGMELPVVLGLISGQWSSFDHSRPETKSDLLCAWDTQTGQLNEKFPTIPQIQFTAMHKAFGQWEMPGLALVQYAIDNEIHHRGEAFVYLRVLGIEPPAFWDRS